MVKLNQLLTVWLQMFTCDMNVSAFNAFTENKIGNRKKVTAKKSIRVYSR